MLNLELEAKYKIATTFQYPKKSSKQKNRYFCEEEFLAHVMMMRNGLHPSSLSSAKAKKKLNVVVCLSRVVSHFVFQDMKLFLSIWGIKVAAKKFVVILYM